MSSSSCFEGTIIRDVTEPAVSRVLGFFKAVGVSDTIPSTYNKNKFYSDLVRGLLVKVDLVQRGKISCLLSVKPAACNTYGSFHGSAVAATAEVLSIACARTVMAEDRELFLGEMSMSYLSAAPINSELKIEASKVRSGKNVTVVAVEFRLQKTGKLVYTARSTFYNTPTANL